MKNIIIKSLLFILASSWAYGEAEMLYNGAIGVSVLNFDNLTGPAGQRIVPGLYIEASKPVGSEESTEAFVHKGKTVQKNRKEAIYGKEVLQLMETSPGAWTLPATANVVAADALGAELSQLDPFRVMRPEAHVNIRTKVNKIYNAYASGVSEEQLMDYFQKRQARYIIAGTIHDYRIDRGKTFAYGLERTVVSTKITLDLKVIDTLTGDIIYQDMPTHVITTAVPTEGSFMQMYDWQEVLRKSVQKASTNLIIALKRRHPIYFPHYMNHQPVNIPPSRAVYTRTESEPMDMRVTLSVNSEPEGADILLDGVFVGNTPAELRVSKGVKVLALELSGYERWENRIQLNEDFKASPTLKELEKLPPEVVFPKHEKKVITVEVK